MKNRNTLHSTLIFFPILIALVLVLSFQTANAQLTATANHDHISVDFFYHGSTMSVRGVSDPGTDLIIKMTSEDGTQTLRKKGKVGGFLWMNVGELHVENVPKVYFLYSTAKMEDILTRSEMDKYVLGYPALQKYVKMNTSDQAEKDRWFNEFVKFKEASNLYTTSTGKISLMEKDGEQDYYILTEWPYQAPPGNYTVTVYAAKDGKVLETATSHVLVEQVGLVKSFASMARNNAAAYGIIAILAALTAGFGVGLVFRKNGGAH